MAKQERGALICKDLAVDNIRVGDWLLCQHQLKSRRWMTANGCSFRLRESWAMREVSLDIRHHEFVWPWEQRLADAG